MHYLLSLLRGYFLLVTVGRVGLGHRLSQRGGKNGQVKSRRCFSRGAQGAERSGVCPPPRRGEVWGGG